MMETVVDFQVIKQEMSEDADIKYTFSEGVMHHDLCRNTFIPGRMLKLIFARQLVIEFKTVKRTATELYIDVEFIRREEGINWTSFFALFAQAIIERLNKEDFSDFQDVEV